MTPPTIPPDDAPLLVRFNWIVRNVCDVEACGCVTSLTILEIRRLIESAALTGQKKET